MRRALAIGVPIAFLALFVGYPLVAIFDLALRAEGSLDLSPVGEVFTDPDLRQVGWFTLWQAAASTFLTLAIGLPAAYVLTRFRFPGRRTIRAAAIAPFALPTVVVGTAFAALPWELAPVAAILLAHACFNVAVVVVIVGSALARVDPSLEDAAAVLGAGRLRTISRVTMPAVRSAIWVSAIVVFLFCLTSFGVVLLLGGPTRATIEVEIWRQSTQLLNLPTAAGLAIVQLLFVGAVLIVSALLEARRSVRRRAPGAAAPLRGAAAPGERIAIVAVIGVMAFVIGAPLLALAGQAFIGPDGFTLSRFTELGNVREGSALPVVPAAAIVNSLLFGAAAAALALSLGAAAAAALAGRPGAISTAFLTLPLGVSAVVLGFGSIVAFDTDPLDLRGTAGLVVAAQAVIALPFVLRTLTPSLRELDAGPKEAAAVLGAPPSTVTRLVVIPLIWRSALVAGLLAFAVALGEFGATTFLAPGDRPTMPVAIARLLSQPGSAALGQAAAMSVLLGLLTSVAAASIERLRPLGWRRP
jgi:thiamine transport system permease protein